MRARTAIESISTDHPHAGTDHSTELRDELASGLVDVASAPLGTLAGLEGSVLDAIVDRLLPATEGIESRLWNQGGVCTGRDEAGT
jgi:hypothetical protein